MERPGARPILLPLSLCGLLTVLSLRAFAADLDASALLEAQCFQCHGGTLQISGLDLRSRDSMLKGGSKGTALVPGNAEASRIYRRVAGLEEPRMPMAPLPPLTPSQVAAIRSWIDRGAPWNSTSRATQPPASNTTEQYVEKPPSEAERQWWAFRKPLRPRVPKPPDRRWSANPIDAFIKSRLDEHGLTPAPAADQYTLVRRAYLDLTGLLPSPDEVKAFVRDSSPKAYEALIDRLLASPHYGERWGRFWLDVVRYADSSGYEHDRDLATAWRYRDYVIRALNQDKPYNRFILEQVAGDELEDGGQDSLIATAFYRIGPRVRFREKDNPYYRYEYLDDIIRTLSQGFMGLSVNCARCHDHKFDPISRADYYRTMALLFGFVDVDHPLVPLEVAAEDARLRKEAENRVRPLRRRIALIEAPYRKAQFEKNLARFPEEIRIAVETPEGQRTPGQRLLAAQIVSLDVDPDAAANQPTSYRNLIKVSEADHEARQKLIGQIEIIQRRLPPALPFVEGVRDGDYRLMPDGPGDEPLPGKGDRFDYKVECCFLPVPGEVYEPPPVHFGANGMDVAQDQKSFLVQPGFLRVLSADGGPSAFRPRVGSRISSGRRLALAEWIVSPDHPLTARVMVNRVWHWHFGRGIVATPSNFGRMGMPPSHPELLDWLATEFVRQSWSLKRLHRLIMTSETYKLASSFATPTNLERDPENVHLWRFPLRRLEAEALRDVILAASGQINLQAGGEPFFPSIPKSVREGFRQGRWELTQEEASTWRRSVYSYWKRGLKYPLFEVHDQPDLNVTCEKRNVTTVPTQALTLLNNEFVLIQSKHLAQRLRRSAGGSEENEIRLLYRIALGRDPSRQELERFLAFAARQKAYHRLRCPQDAAGTEEAALAVLTDLAHVMLNANEFAYIN